MRPAPHPGPRCVTHHRSVIKARKARAHETRVGNTYGLEVGEYDTLHRAQGGVCFICRRATGASRRLSVDHDHRLEHLGMREAVRGLLCRPCNDLLGHCRDDVQMLARAIMYLNDPPARRALK
ncbi:endonuclease VII domain-containing protein [Rhodococcus sp. 11-3]|nr:endonuclease VII domain-containing protein [Rhodococcus sp. 11-3]